MQTDFLKLEELLGLNIRTHGDLGLVGNSAAHIVAHEDLTDEQRVKLNIILGYVSAKTGKWYTAATHYMSAFSTSQKGKLDVLLVMTAGVGAVLAALSQNDYARAKSALELLEAAVDGDPEATVVERVLLDQVTQQVIWRLADAAE